MNKWYFQVDIYNIPLIVLHTTTCSFDQMYQPMDQLSYNLTLTSLNTDFFQNPQFADLDDNGYIPKVTGTIPTVLYTTTNGSMDKPTHYKQLVPLKSTERYTDGPHEPKNTYAEWIKPENWGNPFTQYNIQHDVRFWYGNWPKTDTEWQSPIQGLVQLHEVFFEIRYNPLRDTGIGNKVYFKSNKLRQGSYTSLPDKKDIIITEYPLWIIFWAWYDWQQKLKTIQHIDQDYQIVIQTEFFYPKRKSYVLLDKYFTQPNKEILNETDKANWHPKTEFQMEQLFYIASSGPGTPKINTTKSLECHCNYRFF